MDSKSCDSPEQNIWLQTKNAFGSKQEIELKKYYKGVHEKQRYRSYPQTLRIGSVCVLLLRSGQCVTLVNKTPV
jgi:hypothetical protein